MKTSAQIAFGDGCHPVGVVEFDYAAIDHANEADTPSDGLDALELLQHGLMLAIEDGHADGTRLRAVALLRLSGLFGSDAGAAQFAKVNRSSVSRAVRRMRAKLEGSLSPLVPARNHRKQRE